MRKIIGFVLLILTITLPYQAHAILSMELTRGVASAIPVAVVPFGLQGDTPSQDVSGIVATDLQNSGRFKVYGRSSLNQFPSTANEVSSDYFRRLGTDNVVIGKVTAVGGGRYQVNFQLLDMLRGAGEAKVVLDRKYTVSSQELRSVAHHISDLIYEQMTGVPGVFSTKIAYVVIQRSSSAPTRYILEVADQDGYNPRPLLNSPEPIMSPDWAPNGKQIAYVSFERNKQVFTYKMWSRVQDVY